MNVYSDYFDNYTKLTVGTTALQALVDSTDRCHAILGSITEDQGALQYAPGKWTIKEVIGHINDTERIMSYRALRFARHDATELAGYDENNYARYSEANDRTVADLVDEFETLRKATLVLYRSFSEDTLQCVGSANGMQINVDRLGYVLAGHSLHQADIIQSRYLTA